MIGKVPWVSMREVYVQGGIQRVRANFASQVKKGKMTEQQMEGLMKNLHGTVTYDDFKSVDMVRTPINSARCFHC